MKLYVASSWRNVFFDLVLHDLGEAGIEYYNFRDDNASFNWTELSLDWKSWDAQGMLSALADNRSELAFKNDFDALKECDACLLVNPCGKSAHLEAGYFVGAGKPLVILVDSGDPDLMYKMADLVTPNLHDAIGFFGGKPTKEFSLGI